MSALPQPGRYRVARRSRGIQAGVGEVVDSSTIPLRHFLALVRTRVLVRVPEAESTPVAQEPAPAPLPVEPSPITPTMPHKVGKKGTKP